MIRRANIVDLPAVLSMANDLTAMHVAEGLVDNGAALRAAITAGIRHVFVADDGGELVGFVAWIPTFIGEACGYGTYVKPTHRRAGLSDALRDAAKVNLVANGVKVVTGAVALFNEPAIEAVKKQGFKPVAMLVQLDLGA
jgi:GNAT superfamily N-acetyltransferase